MRLMITRPLEDAEPLAKELSDLGIESIVEPLLDIAIFDSRTPDLSGVQALLLTSANGVRAFSRICDNRQLPVYAVGDASARAARDAGFDKIESASGDVDALAELVLSKLNPDDGALLHIAGTKIAGDLGGCLSDADYDYRRLQLYHAARAATLSDEGLNAIRGGLVDGVILYSPRTAKSFVELMKKAGAVEYSDRMTAFCLSQAVAIKAGGLNWDQVVVADSPNQSALIKSVQEFSRL